jgi:NOL1/NOP2/fmu family ribosome biogenesis protein
MIIRRNNYSSMMGSITPLNSKEKKIFYSKLKEYFGLPDDFVFDGILFVSDKNKYYLISDEYKEIASFKMNSSVLGLYVVEINEYKEIRLSIEGSQIVGPVATKHLLELSEKQTDDFMRGNDLEIPGIAQEFYVLYTINPTTKKKDFFGCAKCKNGILLNFTPKGRRIRG